VAVCRNEGGQKEEQIEASLAKVRSAQKDVCTFTGSTSRVLEHGPSADASSNDTRFIEQNNGQLFSSMLKQERCGLRLKREGLYGKLYGEIHGDNECSKICFGV